MSTSVFVVQRRSWFDWWADGQGGWSNWEDLDKGTPDLGAAQSMHTYQVEAQTEIVTTLQPKGEEHTTRQFRIVERVIDESVVQESAQIGPLRTDKLAEFRRIRKQMLEGVPAKQAFDVLARNNELLATMTPEERQAANDIMKAELARWTA